MNFVLPRLTTIGKRIFGMYRVFHARERSERATCRRIHPNTHNDFTTKILTRTALQQLVKCKAFNEISAELQLLVMLLLAD